MRIPVLQTGECDQSRATAHQGPHRWFCGRTHYSHLTVSNHLFAQEAATLSFICMTLCIYDEWFKQGHIRIAEKRPTEILITITLTFGNSTKAKMSASDISSSPQHTHIYTLIIYIQYGISWWSLWVTHFRYTSVWHPCLHVLYVFPVSGYWPESSSGEQHNTPQYSRLFGNSFVCRNMRN